MTTRGRRMSWDASWPSGRAHSLGMGAAILAVVVLGIVVLGVVGCGPGREEPSRVEVRDAFVTEGSQALAAYLALSNQGGADRIIGATLTGDDASRVERISLHRRGERNGLMIMEPASSIPVEARSDRALVPARAHLMLEGVTGTLVAGEQIAVEVVLEHGGAIDIVLRVVKADEAIALLTDGAPSSTPR